jgi:hypothetical protein
MRYLLITLRIITWLMLIALVIGLFGLLLALLIGGAISLLPTSQTNEIIALRLPETNQARMQLGLWSLVGIVPSIALFFWLDRELGRWQNRLHSRMAQQKQTTLPPDPN